MASSPSETTEIIEHVVLLNINDDEIDQNNLNHPSKVNAIINGLNSLSSSHDSILHLTAGPILRTRSLPSSLKFTHMLHARFLSRDQHVSIADDTICDDVTVFDWSSPLVGPPVPRPGSGMRLTFFKLEEDEDEKVKKKILEELGKIKESLGPFEQKTFGENYSQLGKGFSVATLAVFPDLNELDAAEEYEDQMRSLINKFKISDDHFIAVDYVVPRHSPVTTTTPITLSSD